MPGHVQIYALIVVGVISGATVILPAILTGIPA